MDLGVLVQLGLYWLLLSAWYLVLGRVWQSQTYIIVTSLVWTWCRHRTETGLSILSTRHDDISPPPCRPNLCTARILSICCTLLLQLLQMIQHFLSYRIRMSHVLVWKRICECHQPVQFFAFQKLPQVFLSTSCQSYVSKQAIMEAIHKEKSCFYMDIVCFFWMKI